jgi:hypothetical protein
MRFPKFNKSKRPWPKAKFSLSLSFFFAYVKKFKANYEGRTCFGWEIGWLVLSLFVLRNMVSIMYSCNIDSTWWLKIVQKCNILIIISLCLISIIKIYIFILIKYFLMIEYRIIFLHRMTYYLNYKSRAYKTEVNNIIT